MAMRIGARVGGVALAIVASLVHLAMVLGLVVLTVLASLAIVEHQDPF
jgi:hypothetical protein